MPSRPPVVDVHHHWVPQAHINTIERFLREGESLAREGGILKILCNGQQVHMFDEQSVGRMEAHLADMDAAGVDVAIWSLAIWLEWLDLASAREANDDMAEIQRRSNGRVVGLAHVPPFEEGSIQELERCVRELGLRGVNLTTHWRGVYPDNPLIRPYFRKIAELDVPVVFHAAAIAGAFPQIDSDGTQFGRVMDMTYIVVRLLLGGLLEELPTLRVIVPQMGGSFWAIKRRIGLGIWENALTRKAHLLERIWFDTAPGVWEGGEVDFAIRNLGPDRMMLGSDYPVHKDWMARCVQNVRGAQVSQAEREAVLGGNAAALFGL
ncbi:MAG: amidohydrolase [Chloroflexi bacterium]|nr:amidohydrolase [Chloroflexota bacterium]